MNIEVTFLGTGTSQGVPLIGCECLVCRSLDFRDKRLRTSIHLQVDGKSFVIDTGPDFRQQMLREKINRLDGVILTHEHKDHIAGLDEVRAYNYLQKAHMHVYGEPRVLEHLKKEFAYAFEEVKYPGVPLIDLHSIGIEPFNVAGVTFTPIRVYHYKLPVLGFRVGDFTYITDANRIDELERQKVRGSKVVVLNGLQFEQHISHFTVPEAVDVLEDLAPEKAYLTHISHRLGRHSDVEPKLPEFVKIAWDGLKLKI